MTAAQQKVLAVIAKQLNPAGIVWGVGASMLLAQYGLIDSPADIDIIVSLKDIHEADNLLSVLAEIRNEKEKSDIYLTDFFYEYQLDSVDVDVMSGFKIKQQESVFDYEFDKSSVPNVFEFLGESIPFMTLEEWYVLYQLMPNREFKVNLLEGYFYKRGLEYPHLLERLIQNKSLPETIKCRSLKILSK